MYSLAEAKRQVWLSSLDKEVVELFKERLNVPRSPLLCDLWV